MGPFRAGEKAEAGDPWARGYCNGKTLSRGIHASGKKSSTR